MVSFTQLKPILDIFLRGFSLSSPQHSLDVLSLLNPTSFKASEQIFFIFHVSIRGALCSVGG
jgi:hypothetical protein